MNWIESFFNNASVAAFAGAFAAYLLVVLTDRRRKRTRIRMIERRVRVLNEIALKKLEIVQTNMSLIQEANQFSAAPIIKFPADDLRTLQREALEILTDAQINAIDALVFWMESIDGILAEAQGCAKQLERLVIEDAPNELRAPKCKELLDLFSEAHKNLGLLIGLNKHYLDGQPEKILDFKHSMTP